MIRVLAILVGIYGVLHGTPSSAPAALFGNMGRPLLAGFGSEVALVSHRAAFKSLLDHDEILDLKVRGALVHLEAPGGKDVLESLKCRCPGWTPPEGAWFWALLARDGKILDQGRDVPEAAHVAGVLEAAGEPNPVKELGAFLEQWPGHAEARRDMVQALGPRLRARLRSWVTNQYQGKDLPQDRDAAVWGDVSHHLDLLFQEAPWFLDERGLDELLPSGVPERLSPAMREVYGRAYPSVADGLRRFPISRVGWANLLRMHQALGSVSIVESVERISWFALPPADAGLVPFGDLSRVLLEEAAHTGQWQRATGCLRSLWSQVVRSWAQVPDVFEQGASDASDRAAKALFRRERAWTWMIAPLIRALVRSGAEAEVPDVLRELDASYASLGLGSRIRALACEVGKPLLAERWTEAVGSLPDRLDMEGGPDLGRLQAFLATFPDHLLARAEETVQWCSRSEELQRERLDDPFHEGPATEEAQAWEARFRAQERFLEDPLALCQGPLNHARLRMPYRGGLDEDLDAKADDWARKAMPRVEAALARRPSDPALWDLWKGMARRLGRRASLVLAGLAPSPCAPPGSFPPPGILPELARECQEDARWADLVDLLGRVERDGVDAGPYGGNAAGPAFLADRNLTSLLLEGLLRRGCVAEAEVVLARVRASGRDLNGQDRERLMSVAESLGENAWALGLRSAP